MIAFLQSVVVEGLPVGSVLLLHPGGSEPLFRWRPLSGAPAEGKAPTEPVLDRQQRLTALWKAPTEAMRATAMASVCRGSWPLPRRNSERKMQSRKKISPTKWCDSLGASGWKIRRSEPGAV